MKMIWSAALAVGFSVSAAYGQGNNCGPAPLIEQHLQEGYGEHVAGMGLAQGQIVAFYVNPETGTWTFVTVAPNGIACLRASGDSWGAVDAPPPGTDG